MDTIGYHPRTLAVGDSSSWMNLCQFHCINTSFGRCTPQNSESKDIQTQSRVGKPQINMPQNALVAGQVPTQSVLLNKGV